MIRVIAETPAERDTVEVALADGSLAIALIGQDVAGQFGDVELGRAGAAPQPAGRHRISPPARLRACVPGAGPAGT